MGLTVVRGSRQQYGSCTFCEHKVLDDRVLVLNANDGRSPQVRLCIECVGDFAIEVIPGALEGLRAIGVDQPSWPTLFSTLRENDKREKRRLRRKLRGKVH